MLNNTYKFIKWKTFSLNGDGGLLHYAEIFVYQDLL
jgi:hypothetical protein